MEEDVGSLGKERLVPSIGRGLGRLPLVLGETGPGPFPEERSCRPRGVWELLMARMEEGFRLLGSQK